MKTLLITLLSHFVSIFSFGQQLDDINNAIDGDSLYREGNYAQAIILYKSCIEAPLIKRNMYYFLADSYSKENQLDSSFHYLNIAAQKGLRYRSLEELNSDPLLLFGKEPSWEKLKIKLTNNTEEYQLRLNSKVALKLTKLYHKDQLYRSIYPEKRVAKWGVQKRLDKRNQRVLKRIIRRLRAWPGVSYANREGANVAWVIVQHADNDVDFQKYCLDYMVRAAYDSDVHRPNVAYLIDRVRINQGMEQLYCTQVDGLEYDDEGKNPTVVFKPYNGSIEDVELRRNYNQMGSLRSYIDTYISRFGSK